MNVKYPVEERHDVFGAGSPRADLRHWEILEEEETEGLDVDAPDFESNELVDGGSVCAHCGILMARGAFVRRTLSGELVHESCPDPE